MMDTLVKNAHMDKDKTHQTRRDVSMLQDVTQETKLLVSEITRPAMHAELALFHSSQDQTDQNATDQDQLAHALKDTQLMDTNAFSALTDKSLMTPDKHATQPHNALDQDKFSEQDKTATDVIPAHPTLSQMRPELDVSDQSQSAHAPRDTPLMDMNALNAQIDK